jgi:hypothetical protein
VGLRVVEGEEDQEPYRDGEKGQGERVEPPEGREGAADGGVARRPNREDAGVVAERGRALVAREDVAYDRHVKGTECRCAHPLQQAQRQEQFEAAGEGAKAAGDPEEEQGGDQDLSPSVAVGEDAEDGGQ